MFGRGGTRERKEKGWTGNNSLQIFEMGKGNEMETFPQALNGGEKEYLYFKKHV